jgi:hypothetical protein
LTELPESGPVFTISGFQALRKCDHNTTWNMSSCCVSWAICYPIWQWCVKKYLRIYELMLCFMGYMLPHLTVMCQEISQDICPITFLSRLLTRNHTLESFSMNLISLWIETIYIWLQLEFYVSIEEGCVLVVWFVNDSFCVEWTNVELI